MSIFLIILLLALLLAMFTGWLIGRMVFRVLEKKQSKWANSASICAAMVSLIVVFMTLTTAYSFAGGFRR